MSDHGEITIKRAHVHNLKDIDVTIPRSKLVVITGLSGSGKSSLAFDTLYAEGQRRYVESLSAYARQFLGRMSKPEVDYIKGIPPAIAIEQKVNTRNPRSTVGTSTEIYEYLKLLFARIGKTYSPVSGERVKKHQVSDVIDYILALPEDTRGIILSPMTLPEGRTFREQLEVLKMQGFSRIEFNGKIVRLEDITDDMAEKQQIDGILLVIDRFSVQQDEDMRSRLTDSVQTAFLESKGLCMLKIFNEDGTVKQVTFTNKFEADGMTFDEPSDLMFSFNNPYGACPVCEGFGKVMGIDEDLVVPNKSLSVLDEAVVCWRGEKMSEWREQLIMNAGKAKFPIHKPYFDLTENERKMLWKGTPYFLGIDDFFKFVEENQYKIQYRVMLSRYRGKTVCPMCHGTRLRPEASYVKVGGKTISELVLLPISELKLFFSSLKLSTHEQQIARRLLIEITNRIQFLMDVGLSYLTLNRLSNTLSGGESQRINLATSLGSSLVGSLYILDEPSIGLHPRDTNLLIKVLRQLQALGNTVVVVEHDEEIMRAADYLIDIGPEAGRLGGQVIFQGALTEELLQGKNVPANSHTFDYLTGKEQIEVPSVRRKWSNYIEVLGARQNNLKGINVKFPLNVITAVTGVSGSGKSSLVRDVFYSALKKQLGGVAEKTGLYESLQGSFHLVKDVEFVDQNPIGKSSRSNPVTYIKAYDEIRKLFADQPLSKQMGYTAAYFSFNVDGGRCEECQGEGTITVEMQFMADLVLTCEACHGKRFKQDILDVTYRGATIYDVLEMTVNQAIEFFSQGTGSTGKRIVKRLKPLQDVGLGYIKLGQSSSTLSGGESQRVKLAAILSNEKPEPSIFIFDEPTTGLHFHDIKTLMKAFNALIASGHTVIIIEHNPDVIKCADHIIDIGPEGGEKGGNLVFTGTPEELITCEESFTGKFLKGKVG
ncbi:MAG: excinuclease ABC subunit UvrA [Prevotellaceae bacterium]|jgi:excinuclease ABC subunit A|nr:excinuclease ABC subunit UvrA [Prevotellaceae bacterium]